MRVLDFLAELRTLLNDTQAIEFSDKELIDHANAVIRKLSMFLANSNAWITRKEAEMTFTDGKSPLPSDFLRDVELYTKEGRVPYNIVNNEIVVSPEVKTATLLYHFWLPQISTTEEDLQVPEILHDALKYGVVVLAKTRIEAPMKVESELEQVFTLYALPVITRYSNPPHKQSLPFVV